MHSFLKCAIAEWRFFVEGGGNNMFSGRGIRDWGLHGGQTTSVKVNRGVVSGLRMLH